MTIHPKCVACSICSINITCVSLPATANSWRRACDPYCEIAAATGRGSLLCTMWVGWPPGAWQCHRPSVPNTSQLLRRGPVAVRATAPRLLPCRAEGAEAARHFTCWLPPFLPPQNTDLSEQQEVGPSPPPTALSPRRGLGWCQGLGWGPSPTHPAPRLSRRDPVSLPGATSAPPRPS